MSCGVPLVASTGGAIPEVVGPDGHAAIHVPPGDAGAMAQAISTLMQDPQLRRDLGRRGRQRVVDNFTWRRCAELTAEHYRQAIAQRQERPGTS